MTLKNEKSDSATPSEQSVLQPASSTLDSDIAAARQEMDGLVTIIKLHSKPLMGTMKHEIERQELRLEFGLSQLLKQSQLQELQLKIASMKNVVEVLKRI
jgi:hypothetical protein